MKIGANIRSARQATGLSQEALAEQLGITQSWLSKYELDKLLPGPEILTRMADVLGARIPGGLTVDQLLGRAPLPEATDASA
jgi:transcriptional regulator with XRE-family HTH domain